VKLETVPGITSHLLTNSDGILAYQLLLHILDRACPPTIRSRYKLHELEF
jgi:hypothetical protein